MLVALDLLVGRRNGSDRDISKRPRDSPASMARIRGADPEGDRTRADHWRARTNSCALGFAANSGRERFGIEVIGVLVAARDQV